MSFLDAARNISLEARWAVEKLSRERGQLKLKMELFEAGYDGPVMDTSIPMSANSGGPEYSRLGDFVSCYVRVVLADSKVTRFFWFNNMPAAQEYVAKKKQDPAYSHVIGPYPLPKDKEDRYR